MKKLKGKYCARLLKLNLHQLALVFSWMKWKPVYLKTKQLQLFIWFRYIDGILFIWTHSEEQLKLFLKDLNDFHPILKFTYETSQNNVNFSDLNVSLKDGAIFTDLPTYEIHRS